jgi:hypothetical protein
MKTKQEINKYIKENWDTLPKSKFDDLEVVIFNEVTNSDGGWGHHSYEGYGVDKEGKYRWLFSSGCSCGGGTSENDTMKSIPMSDESFTKIDPTIIDFNSLSVEFKDY